MTVPAIVAHGGAGAGPERLANVERAVAIAAGILESGGSAVDAAVEAFMALNLARNLARGATQILVPALGPTKKPRNLAVGKMQNSLQRSRFSLSQIIIFSITPTSKGTNGTKLHFLA